MLRILFQLCQEGLLLVCMGTLLLFEGAQLAVELLNLLLGGLHFLRSLHLLELLFGDSVPLVDHFEQALINKRNAITRQQLKKMKASQRVQSTQQKIEKLHGQLDAFKEKERSHADKERTLRAELKEYEKRNLATLKPFVRSTALMERKLVSQMEAKLEGGTDGLFSLNEKGSPKLGLLLNCFGAEANTIQALRNLSSADLLSYGDSEVESMVWALPKDQQIVVLYARDRLEKGKLPYAGHECAICD